jgi:hypothetical protein
MKRKGLLRLITGLGILLALLLLGPTQVLAHCDTMDGPVVQAAQEALATGNVKLVLIWVQKKDEAKIDEAFQKTLAVRKLGGEARELADMYFFETLVRIHRVGEGAPYTGLKPAGLDMGPAIPAADKAIADGKLQPLGKLLIETMHTGLHKYFEEAVAKRYFDRNDVEAGREYVEAYVRFIHYVEGLYQAGRAKGVTDEHQEAPCEHESEGGVHQH